MIKVSSQRPLVSIVMPTYNSEAFLADALQSINSQAFKNWELIVVDDGSESSPINKIQSMISGATVLTQPNSGPSAARNAAIRRSCGDLITFLDSDDYWAAAALPALLRGLANAPGAGMIQAHVKQVFEAVDTTRTGPAYLSFNVGSILVPRHTLDRTGPFDERLRQSEDVDFHIRFKEAGLKKLVIPETVLYYRRHKEASTNKQRPRILQTAHHGNWMRLLGQSLKRRRENNASNVSLEQPASVDRPGLDCEPVTAIICAKNARRFLPAAIQSIRRQTLPVHRIVAIAGDSEDETAKFLKEQPDVAVVCQSRDGLANARNTALELVNSGYVAFLDADDEWAPRKLELQMEALSLLQSPGYSITNFQRRPVSTSDDQPTFPGSETVGYRLGTTPSTLVAHTSIFKKVGAFDASLGNACDTDWFSRALNAELPCAVLGQCLMHKALHDQSLSADNLKNRKDTFRLLAKRRQSERRPPQS